MNAGDFPITLLTTAILGLIYSVLCINVVRQRIKAKIAIGHDNPALLQHYRAQANFMEYVPLCLILLALLENVGRYPLFILIVSVSLIVARILHAWGMTRPRELHWARRIGALLTLLVLWACCVLSLIIFFG